MFKIKDGYKLELQTHETMKLLGCTKTKKQKQKKPKTRKYDKGHGCFSFTRNTSNKYGKQLLDAATKPGLDAAKTAFKKYSIKQLKQ